MLRFGTNNAVLSMKRHGLGLAILLLLPLLIFSKAYHAPFVYDDSPAILENASITQLWPPIVALRSVQNLPTAGRPLVNYSFALNYCLFGPHPENFRVVNIAIHLLNTCLVYALLVQLLGLASTPRWLSSRQNFWAFVIAIIWSLHPIQTEAVVYITQRTELLVSFFILCTLVAASKGFSATDLQARRLWLGLSVLACFFGTLCKEVMIMAPLLVVLLDYVFFSPTKTELWRKNRLYYLALWTSWIPVVLIMLSGPRKDSVGTRLGISPWEYLNTQAVVIITYIRQIFLPYDLSLAGLFLLHDFPRTVPLVVFLGLWFIAICVAVYHRRWWGAAGLWFYLILAPSSSVMPIVTELMAERRMYLPLLGILVPAVVGLAWAIEKVSQLTPGDAALQKQGDRVRWLIVGLVVITVAMGCFFRLDVWQNSETIWRDAVQKYPDNVWVNTNLAGVYVHKYKYPQAMEQYTHAVRLMPGNAMVYVSLSRLLNTMGRTRQAMLTAQHAVMINPSGSLAQTWYGEMLIRQNRHADAIPHLKLATHLSPTIPEGWSDLAYAAWLAGEVQLALDSATQLLKISPADVSGLSIKAMALARLGQLEPARIAAEQAIKNAPTRNEGWLAAVEVDGYAGQPQKVIARFEEALRNMPRSGVIREAYIDWLLKNDRINEAREMSLTCYQRDPQRFGFLLRVAQVSVRQGQWEQAVSAAETALRFANDKQANLEQLGQLTDEISEKIVKITDGSVDEKLRNNLSQLRTDIAKARDVSLHLIQPLPEE